MKYIIVLFVLLSSSGAFAYSDIDDVKEAAHALHACVVRTQAQVHYKPNDGVARICNVGGPCVDQCEDFYNYCSHVYDTGVCKSQMDVFIFDYVRMHP